MIDKIIELFEKGYCNDCNELNCLGGEPSSKIVAKAIKKLQQENELLKQALNEIKEYIIKNSHYNSPDYEYQLLDKRDITNILQIIDKKEDD